MAESNSQENPQKKKNQSQQNQQNQQKQQEEPQVITCQKCTKFFTSQAAYEVHMKMKHQPPVMTKVKSKEEQELKNSKDQEYRQKPEKKPAAKRPGTKNRALQMQQNQCEDNIYAFLGQLGERNAQTNNNRSDFILQSENQRLTGQTNYSLNKVVRTPYEEPIKATDHIPDEEINKSNDKEFLLTLKKQIIELQEAVQAEKQKWQLRDPMAPDEQSEKEFSLMDIRKLIINYPSKGLKLKYPHFSIFLLWVARICKPAAFKEFFMILGTYLAKYHSKEERNIRQNCYQVWKNYFKNNQSEIFDANFNKTLSICDAKSCLKFVEYFVQWNYLYNAMDI